MLRSALVGRCERAPSSAINPVRRQIAFKSQSRQEIGASHESVGMPAVKQSAPADKLI
jgi:hypothetical protein